MVPAQPALLFLCGLLSAHSLWAQPTIVEYPIPTSASIPWAITAGPDGNLWFTETATSKIAKIALDGTITEYATPTAPSAITKGPDGNLWFTEGAGKIGRISTSGTITEYPTRPGVSLSGITSGPDGNLWFAEYSGGHVGRITPAGTITEYPLTSLGYPYSITAGPDGNLWCTDIGRIWKITTGGAVTSFGLSAGGAGITSGPDGNLWFTTGGTSMVGKISTSGTAANYPAFTPGAWQIASGPDGNLWFTENSGITRLTTSLVETQYAAPTSNSGPQGLASGPDGNIWFTEAGSNKIAKLVMSTVPAVNPLAVTPASLAFSGVQGGTAPPAQTFSVSASSPISFTASTTDTWFSITPSGSLNTNQTITVNVNLSVLSANTYSGAILLTSGNVTQLVPVTVTVTPGTPVISLLPMPLFLQFSGASGGAAPAAQTFQVGASGNAAVPVSISATSTGNWLSVTPPSGTTPATFSASAALAGLAVGLYGGTITINGSGAASGQSATIHLSLEVGPPPALSVSVSSLNFTAVSGGPPPPSQTFTVTAPSPTAFSIFSNNSMVVSVSPSGSLNTPQTITVSANQAIYQPGTYTINISIGSATYSPSLPVNLTVTPAAPVIVTPSSLGFTYQIGGPLPAAQQIAVGTSNGLSQAFNSSSSGWMVVAPGSGTAPATLSVSVNPAGMIAGTYSGSVAVTAVGGPAVNVAVNLVVQPIALIPASLSFSYAQGGGAPGPQSLQVGTQGAQVGFTASSNAAWLSVSPVSSVTPTTLAVSVAGNLTAGTYHASISITTLFGAAASVPVTVVVAPDARTVSFSPPTLTFSYQPGRSAPPPPLLIGSTGENVGFTASSNAAWLSVSPTSGNTPATLSVSIAANLQAGTYGGAITITPAGGSAVSAPVSLVVSSAAPAPAVTATPASLTFSSQLGGSPPAQQTLQLSGPAGAALFFIAAATSAANWLSVSSTTGSTPASLTVSVAPAGLAIGTYIGAITLDPGALTIPVLLAVTSAAPNVTAVVNAASFTSGAVAPGEMITIGGAGLGPASPFGLSLDQTGKVSTALGGVSVSINGYLAPLVYVSATQINCVVPYEVAGILTPWVQVTYGGVTSNMYYTLSSSVAAPAIFTLDGSGAGLAAAVNSAGCPDNAASCVNGIYAPAPQGSMVVFYLTGEGQTAPAGETGAVTVVDNSSGQPFTPRPLLPLTVMIGGQPANVLFYGEAPGVVSGVLQVNVQVPTGLSPGSLPLVVSLGANNSQNGVLLAVE